MKAIAAAVAAASLVATSAGAQPAEDIPEATVTIPDLPDTSSAPPNEGRPMDAARILNEAGIDIAKKGASDGPTSVAEVIEGNLEQPDKICPASTPLILASPSQAADLIDGAKIHPELAELLAHCLSQIQQSMKQSDPEGAEIIASLISIAPPAFQAAYAVALAPEESVGSPSGDVAAAGPPADSGSGGGAADSGGNSSGEGSGGGSGSGFGGVGFGGFAGGGGGGIGGGGGNVSPSTPAP